MQFRAIFGLAALATFAGCSPASEPNASADNVAAKVASDADNLQVAAGDNSAALGVAPPEPEGQSVETADAATLPAFDSNAYCRTIGDAAGGSAVIERTCREQESEARSEAAAMSIPARTLNYCTKIGETAGGSYLIFKTCVEQEIGAAAEL